jgi:hypothetical protein
MAIRILRRKLDREILIMICESVRDPKGIRTWQQYVVPLLNLRYDFMNYVRLKIARVVTDPVRLADWGSVENLLDNHKYRTYGFA